MYSGTSPPETVEVTVLDKFWDFLHAPGRTKALTGGAGSGKSHSVAQYWVEMATNHEDLVLTAMRKTLPALKRSNWKLLKDTFKAWRLPVLENKNEMTLTFEPTGSVIYGLGLDDPEKIKSFDVNASWLEEATEFTREDYTQAHLRCRRPGPIENQVVCTFNPIDAYHWCITDLVQGHDPSVAVLHSNYKDNPFLDRTYVEKLLSLEKTDRNFYRIYCLGEPGVLENVIYPDYEVLAYERWPRSVRERGPDAYGMDFGFVDPTTMIDVRIHDSAELYVHEVLYEPGLTTSSLIRKMGELQVSKNVDIFADSAEPDRIAEICDAGYNAKPTEKKPITVGIDTIKSYRIIVSSESTNLLKEIRGYKRRETRDGRVLEEPVDYLNHALDAMRYGVMGSRGATSPIIWYAE